MAVDRSVSGIRVSGRAEKRRPTTRFPVQMSSKVNHRRSSVRADAWRQKHARRTRQLGRVRPQPTADVAVRPPPPDFRSIDPTNRRPLRSLTIALLLAAATVAGVGMAAWAISADPVPAAGVPGGSGPTGSTGTDEQSTGGAVTTALRPTDGAGRRGTAGSTPAGTPSDQLPSAQLPVAPLPAASLNSPAGSAPPSPLSNDDPAVVSTLAPGDPGFGWPSSAFGSAAP